MAVSADQYAQLVGADAAAQKAIINGAMPMHQVVETQTLTAAQIAAGQNVFTFQPKLAGLIRGFYLQIDFSLTNTGASAAARTQGGVFNALSNVQFIDPANITRINAPGWALEAVASSKSGTPFGGAVAPNLPAGYGSNYNVNSLASSIAAAGTEAGRVIYYIPVAYSDTVLDGAVLGQVNGVTMQVQAAVNTAPGFTTGSQALAIAGGASTAVAYTGTVTARLTQVFWDQLPRNKNGQLILPPLALSKSYLIQSSNYSSLVVNTDNAFMFSNARTYLSSTFIYDNGTALNAGTDITSWRLEYSNALRQWDVNPAMAALLTRQILGADVPTGYSHFSHRDWPIDTANYGAAQIVMVPSTVNAGAVVRAAYEMIANNGAVIGASSLPTPTS